MVQAGLKRLAAEARQLSLRKERLPNRGKLLVIFKSTPKIATFVPYQCRRLKSAVNASM